MADLGLGDLPEFIWTTPTFGRLQNQSAIDCGHCGLWGRERETNLPKQGQKSIPVCYSNKLKCPLLCLSPDRGQIEKQSVRDRQTGKPHFQFPYPTPGRRGGLMVSALDSGSNGPGSSPGLGSGDKRRPEIRRRSQAMAGALRCVLGQDTILS